MKCNAEKIESSDSATNNNEKLNSAIRGIINLMEPSMNNLRRTKELIDTLKIHNIFESEDELNHRTEVINQLDNLVKQWVRDIYIKKGVEESVANQAGGKVYVIGSCRLGVNDKETDMDIVCALPCHVTRKDFFTSFCDLLNSQPNVTDLRAIENRFMPIIKMNFNKIEIDLLCSRLSLECIPDSLQISDDKLLKNLDKRCARSLFGCRVNEEILRLVPDQENFRLTLRTIKLWAKKKGIYHNSLGYLGGVSWAILVAKVCQAYPNAVASTLVEKFFHTFSLWNWPQPVLLKHPESLDLGLRVWNPEIYFGDREHLMPIITPTYPQQNTTLKVSKSTMTMIKKEIESGLAVVREIEADKLTWDKLFEPSNFFEKYDHYLVIIISSKTAEDHVKWSGQVQAKIRPFIRTLEKNPSVVLIQINPEEYRSSDPELGQYVSMRFIGIKFVQQQNLYLHLMDDVKSFIRKFGKLEEVLELIKNGKNIEIDYVNIADPLIEEKLKTFNENKENHKISDNCDIF